MSNFMAYSVPLENLDIYFGASISNLKVTIEGRQKDIIEDKWVGMMKITALQQAKSLKMSSEDSLILSEFVAWYLREISVVFPPMIKETDNMIFGPNSYCCYYETPMSRIFKCKSSLKKDYSITLNADNIIKSQDGVLLSRVILKGQINLGPISETKATEVFLTDNNLMLVGTFPFQFNSTSHTLEKAESSAHETSKKDNKK
ncbi:TPA_asm: M [Corylus betacytorhabdovirus 1]|nr:TPA_asm: M [Corylus betacytorhabdovirus 1]